MLCRHCHRAKANRPRGLCWTCYYAPGVRDLYPSTSKYARRGFADTYATPALDAEPTTARPGSPEKAAVLARRAALGMTLWHPQDEALDLRHLDAEAVPLAQNRETGRHLRRSPRASLPARRERAQRVRELRQAGHSFRVIARELGIGVGTVQNDLAFTSAARA